MDYLLRGFPKLDLTEDIHVIQGSEESPISFLQLKELIEKLHHQMMEIEVNRSYSYEGIIFNKRTNMYEINWGS
jgi:hypothetical protein